MIVRTYEFREGTLVNQYTDHSAQDERMGFIEAVNALHGDAPANHFELEPIGKGLWFYQMVLGTDINIPIPVTFVIGEIGDVI